MTDNEIIKALECCIDYNACDKCDFEPKENTKKTIGCCLEIMQNALDLINRLTDQLNSAINGQETLQGYVAKQDKEIERLKANLNVELDNFASEYDSKIKSEAVKEFAERLKKKIINTPFGIDCTGETDEYREGCLRGLVAKQHNVIDMVDNLLKEMVGENK